MTPPESSELPGQPPRSIPRRIILTAAPVAAAAAVTVGGVLPAEALKKPECVADLYGVD